MKSKRMKSILLKAGFALGLSLAISAHAYAATYTTVSGDSLYKISQIYYTTVDNLMNRNNLTNYSLDIGQTLNVPSSTHTVQRGDTLFFIAQRYKIPFNTIRRANNIYTDELHIGQIVNVPQPAGLTAGAPLSDLSAVSGTSGAALTSAADTLISALASAVSSESSSEPSFEPSSEPSFEVAPLSDSAAATDTPPAAKINTAESEPAAGEAVETAYSASDLDLLSRLIMAEAQAEPYDAKVAVGAVVMNRVKAGSFPDSVSDVIYQNINGYYQFTPVVNGWIDKPANADCIKAAKAALSGVDPTNESLFYYDNTTTNPWILAKPVSTKIGNMVYAY
ncbi:LysM peptidoglycan-binding domain-containing protein [Sinanaerobacter chloroacetimidivorans]|nr:LysM peptidoglycan-binding domain-containing protein [Sinanaerobacter chloroacetimidivorans]